MPNESASEILDIFDRSYTQKRLASALVWSLFLASVFLAVLLIWHSFHVRGSNGSIDDYVRLGPLSLLKISTEPTSNNNLNISFTWLAGIGWYYLTWLLIGFLWVVPSLIRRRS